MLIEAGLFDAAVSRAYYALYHLMVLAIVQFERLSEAEVNDWKHKTVVSTFIKRFCQRSFLLDARDAGVVARLLKDRSDADYHDEVINQARAERSVHSARGLFTKMLEALGGEE